MIRIENRFQLKQVRAECQAETKQEKCRVLICGGTGCLAGGSAKLYEHMKELAAEHENVQVEIGPEIAHIGVHKSGCHGFCEMGPLMRIEPYGYLYLKVQESDCGEIFEKTVLRGQPVERLMFRQDNKVYPSEEEIPFYAKQTRLVVKYGGNAMINEELKNAVMNDLVTLTLLGVRVVLVHGGGPAINEMLKKVGVESHFANGLRVTDDATMEIVQQVLAGKVNKDLVAKLRGRGGAGFPAGKKWSQVAAQKETVRYVVCNGDEGDPGAFMDRSIMEGDPHRMIEGMLIAAYAVGAQEGYIYVRAEYPLAIERLKLAIAQAEEAGFLGDNILGTDFCFRLHINRGAGAFVCGEGSALTASIEGKRGMPRVKPPRTVEHGLWEKPTVLNNVETYANVPMIIQRGAEWYRGIGTPESPGTKAFALTGNVCNTGLIEVPMGTPLRDIVFDVGGGIPNGKKFKAVQIGGPSGGCLSEKDLDRHMDFDSLTKIGAMIGSGGMVVMDEDTCMVEVARFFMSFTQRESCGKCVPCREGTQRMLEILERIVAGQGTMEDLDTLRDLADMIENTALCGLGKSAPKPVISTLNAFRDEYVAHIRDRRCPAGVCSKLRVYSIDPAKCKGCSKCARNCPASAIHGTLKSPYTIDQDACIRCGSCVEQCAFGAITVEK